MHKQSKKNGLGCNTPLQLAIDKKKMDPLWKRICAQHFQDRVILTATYNAELLWLLQVGVPLRVRCSCCDRNYCACSSYTVNSEYPQRYLVIWNLRCWSWGICVCNDMTENFTDFSRLYLTYTLFCACHVTQLYWGQCKTGSMRNIDWVANYYATELKVSNIGLFQIISDPTIEGNFFSTKKRWNSKTGLTEISGIPRAVDQKKEKKKLDFQNNSDKKVWNSNVKKFRIQQKLEFQVVKSKKVWNSRCGHVLKKVWSSSRWSKVNKIVLNSSTL